MMSQGKLISALLHESCVPFRSFKFSSTIEFVILQISFLLRIVECLISNIKCWHCLYYVGWSHFNPLTLFFVSSFGLENKAINLIEVIVLSNSCGTRVKSCYDLKEAETRVLVSIHGFLFFLSCFHLLICRTLSRKQPLTCNFV